MSEVDNEVTKKGDIDEKRLRKDGNLKNEDLMTKLYYGTPLTHDEIADIFGVSRVAVTNKVKRLGLERKYETPKEYEAKMGDDLMNKIQVIMNQITADKISKASLSQLGTLLGILYDKRQLHEKRGTPEVSYVGVVHKFDPKSLESLKEVMQVETQKRLEESKAVARKTMQNGAVEAEYEAITE
jgi:predicted DNA-binding protein YlxM (UPF0122 family)